MAGSFIMEFIGVEAEEGHQCIEPGNFGNVCATIRSQVWLQFQQLVSVYYNLPLFKRVNGPQL